MTQDLPLYFVLTGDVCQSTIELSTPVLDYGRAYISQCSTLPITVTNTSMLAQKIGFVRVPKELVVEPNDGFCCLLPQESMTFQVGFAPKSVIDYDFKLTLMTSSNDTYEIQIKGKGVELPLSFSVPVIKMRTTCPGERVLESCVVENKTNSQQCCEIISPDPKFTWLRISPAVVDLAPGGSCRIDVEYIPPTNLITVDPLQWHDDLVASLTPKVEVIEGEDPPVEMPESSDNVASDISPFDKWVDDSGWRIGTGMYGKLQWSIPPPVISRTSSVQSLGSLDSADIIDEGAAIEGGGEDGSEGQIEPMDDPVAMNLALPQTEFLPPKEWGIIGNWRIPVLFRPKSNKRSAACTYVFVCTNCCDETSD